jgi:soluble lytic murein transglycosylase-like protein
MGARRPPWRVVLSALAGGGLTAASLGGPLAGGAFGAEGTTGSTTTDGAPPPTATTPQATGEPTQEVPWEPSSTSTTTSTQPSQPTAPPTTTAPTTPAPTGTSADEAPTVVVRHKQRASKSKPASTVVTQTKAQSTGGKSANGGKTAAPGAPNNVALPPQLVAGQAGALAALLGGSANAASVQALDFYRIPLFLLPIYRAAAIRYGVPWPILAAINEIETNYGTDLSVSSAGAEGWMQFEPSTWLQYGVDALNAGYADPYNPIDAIYAAARYLNAAGAAHNLSGAVFAYNHSEAYVSSVLLRAKLIAAYPNQVIATLTGLIDGRPPVTGKHIGWGRVVAPLTSPATATTQLPPSSSATAGATATSASAPTAGSLTTPGAVTPPSPTTAASTTSAAPRLVDVRGEPNARAVAVQDGRIVKLGYSRKLGRYVILRDVYGDMFTYAGLGGIAHSYKLPKSESAAILASHSARASARVASASSPGASATGSKPAGKVRVFARPYRNPDAQAAIAGARISAGTSTAGGQLPLRVGSVVTEGTVLGRVKAPQGARDGHLRFAIQPAGDASTIDPRAILANWAQLDAALHPQGAKAGRSNLLGATASDVFLLSKGQLEREVLSDPGVALSACSRHEVASGAIDKRALAVLAFLSRSGLKPTVDTLRCGKYDAAGYVSPGHVGDAVAIVGINGVPIAGHQGAGSITDTTIRTLLTLHSHFTPARIVSLMRYPGAPSTLARADHGDYIEIAFRPAPHPAALQSPTTAAVAHPAGVGQTAPAPPVAIMGELSVAQWEQLIGRIAGLPKPTVVVKPSSAAIPDSQGQAGKSQSAPGGAGVGPPGG